jgi:hypothetical protein
LVTVTAAAVACPATARRLLALLSAASLALCVVTCALWAPSRWPVPPAEFESSGSLWRVAVDRGEVTVDNEPQRRLDRRRAADALRPQLDEAEGNFAAIDARNRADAREWADDESPDWKHLFRMAQEWDRAANARTKAREDYRHAEWFDRTTSVGWSFPLWWLAVATAVIPLSRRLVASAHARRVRERRDRGLCPACGDDLRRTPSRCPECGAEPVGDE